MFQTDLFETGSKHGLGSEEYSGFTKSPAEQKGASTQMKMAIEEMAS